MMLKEKIVRFCLLLLRLGMGGFFLFVAARKLLHLDQLQETIDRFAIFPEAWGHPLACLGVSCEIAVGLGLLFRRTCAGAALLGSALTFTFVALFVQGWISPDQLAERARLFSKTAYGKYLAALLG